MRMRCPHCDHRFRVTIEAAGKRGRCPNPNCGQVVRVPDAAAFQKSARDAGATASPQRGKPVGAPPAIPSSRRKSAKPPPRKPARRQLYYVGIAAGMIIVAAGVSWLGTQTGIPTGPQPAIAAGTPQPAAAPADYQKDLKPFIQKYCSDCHGNGAQEGDFALDRYADIAAIKNDRAVWTKVLKLVELKSMPPSDGDQPTDAERAQAVAWLDHQLFFVDCSTEQNPGHVTVRRLNKTEYNNTVHSLLGITFKPAADFPSDDVGYGFDNIGDVLTVPPLLVEKYLAAAETIAATAARATSPVYFENTIHVGEFEIDGAVQARGPESVFISRGRISKPVTFPRAGKYQIRIPARQDKSGKEPARMVISLDQGELKSIDVPNVADLKDYDFQFQAPAGKHELSITFVNDFYNPDVKKERDRNLRVGDVQLEGPVDLLEEERRQVPLTRVFPEGKNGVMEAAAANLKPFLPRAFRRPVTDEELQRYTGLVEMAVNHGATFEEGMGIALQAILVSPDFLFRVEGGRRRSGQVEMLDDYALASRLSYFLWSTSPDDQLFELAKDQQLHKPEVLKEQTLRMLRDPRAQEFIANFAGQWLGLRKLTTSEIDPDTKLFPDFNADIRQDLWKETELYFSSIVRDDRSIFDLLVGQYSFLNERLAKYYGVPGVKGPEFRRVDLKGQHRLGLLTQGSVLTLTSYPDRTSPVRRGQWVLEVLLNDAPPPPPPTVPGLDETTSANPNLSFRESLELHRKDPGCASCHKVMDEIGFGLENFDAIGRWRTQEKNRPVDASGKLPSGEEFNGPDELVAVLLKRRDQFARCLTEKVMTYAIGRGVEWYDECAISEILQQVEQDDHFSTVVLGIVNSAPFQSRKLQDSAPATP